MVLETPSTTTTAPAVANTTAAVPAESAANATATTSVVATSSTAAPTVPNASITVQAPLTPATNTAPVIASIPAKELSGAQWVARFLGSASIDDCVDPFKSAISNFIAALKTAGATVRISATYRPPERAYMMHYSSSISKGEIKADKVPAMAGVNIEWVHATDEASKKAASAMASGFQIVHPPALVTRHTQRAAIDMTITEIVGKKINNASGVEVEIKKLSDLHAVGASYGAHKLVSDPPHWSVDGH